MFVSLFLLVLSRVPFALTFQMRDNVIRSFGNNDMETFTTCYC